MDAFEMTGTAPDGKKASAWVCGKCRRVQVDEAFARTCCDRRCSECSTPVRAGALLCDVHWKEREQRREQERFEKATKIPVEAYDHEYVCIGYDSYVTVDHWRDGAECGEAPRWAWAVTDHGMPRLDATSILESALEEHHEDAIDEVDTEGLQLALDEWRAKQSMRSFFCDESRAVVLNDAKALAGVI